MRRETLDRPNLASRKKSVERSLRRVILSSFEQMERGTTNGSRFPVSVKRYATTNHFLHRCIDEHSPTTENENKINELFVVHVSMHRGMHRGQRFSLRANLDRESFKFYFFFSPPFLFSLFSSFLAFFVCFFRFSFFFSTLCNKKPFHSSRYVSIAQSFVPLLLLMLLQKKREREGKKDRTLFSPSPLVFILFNRVFGERAILFFARCFSCSGETRRK